MPGLYVRDTGGVSRKYRELHETQSGVDRKLREMYARDGGGVNRKIFSSAPKWEITSTRYASWFGYTLCNGSDNQDYYASITYTLKSDNFLLMTGGYIDIWRSSSLPDNENNSFEIVWHVSDENGHTQAAESFNFSKGSTGDRHLIVLSNSYHVKTVMCEFNWRKGTWRRAWMDMYLYTDKYGRVYVHEE